MTYDENGRLKVVATAHPGEYFEPVEPKPHGPPPWILLKPEHCSA